MKTGVRLSETDWEIMRVIWERHPITAAAILEELSKQDSTWHPKTARTFLNRLVQKGVLAYQAEGRSYRYEPLVAEKDCMAVASESFLQRVLGGSLKPMLAHLIERRRLDRCDLEELRELLERELAKKSARRRRPQ
jgi:BlaI family penicillinase repressor